MNKQISDEILTLANYINIPEIVTFSGSLALSVMGLLPPDRVVHDIDIVFSSLDSFQEFTAKCPELVVIPLTDRATSRYQEDYLKVKLPNTPISIDIFIKNEAISNDNVVNGFVVEHFRDIYAQKLRILFDRVSLKDETYYKHLKDMQYLMEKKLH